MKKDMPLTFTRREIIKKMAAGSLTFPLLAATEKNGRPIRFGVIGFGDAGETLAVQLLRSDRQAAITAVCDIWEYRQKRGASLVKTETGNQPALYVDHAEMLQKEKGRLDAVIVATPDSFHEKHALACLDAGLHVYCESPMADSSASAKHIAAAVRHSGRVFQYASFQGRNLWTHHCKKHFLGVDGLLGKTIAADSEICSCPQRRSGSTRISGPSGAILSAYGYRSNDEFLNWRFSKKFGIGYDLSWFVQQADFFTYMLSAYPSRLVASCTDVDDMPWAKSICAYIEYATADGRASCNSRFFPVNSGNDFQKHTVRGKHGIIQSSLMDTYIQQIDANPKISSDKSSSTRLNWENAYKNGTLGKEYEQNQEPDGYIPLPFDRLHNRKFHFPFDRKTSGQLADLKDFVSVIRGSPQVYGSAADGLASMVLAEAVRESASTGKSINFDHSVFDAETNDELKRTNGRLSNDRTKGSATEKKTN
jgi:predicted dehydrogenase